VIVVFTPPFLTRAEDVAAEAASAAGGLPADNTVAGRTSRDRSSLRKAVIPERTSRREMSWNRPSALPPPTRHEEFSTTRNPSW
jgi:hypothetical protein